MSSPVFLVAQDEGARAPTPHAAVLTCSRCEGRGHERFAEGGHRSQRGLPAAVVEDRGQLPANKYRWFAVEDHDRVSGRPLANLEPDRAGSEPPAAAVQGVDPTRELGEAVDRDAEVAIGFGVRCADGREPAPAFGSARP